jgi:acetyltransferase-like isoleucine patch superfamily enzyme
MKGKNLFTIFKPILIALHQITRILPVFIINFLWNLLTPFEGKISCGFRYVLLARLCKSCGDNIFIGRNVTLKNVFNLTIGSNVSIHSNSYIDAIGDIDIRDNVSIAHNCSLISFDHTWEDKTIPIKYNDTKNAPIIIDTDVWVGCGVRILSGTTIKPRTVIAAGSVIKGECQGYSIYAGIPAKKIKGI